MVDLWNHFSLTVGDRLLGWLLAWPRDAALVALALGSSAILTAVRRWTTNQDLLCRVADDGRRVKVLLRAAKQAHDGDSLRRLRATKPRLAWLSLRAEGAPLLVALPPLAILATWCMHRLEFVPPHAGEPLEIAAYAPYSSSGNVMHLVPQAGLNPERWVQPIESTTDNGLAYGSAVWVLHPAAGTTPYHLTFRSAGRNCERELLVGQPIYSPPIAVHDGQFTTELRMRPYRPFHVTPGIPALFVPPWLVGYALLTIVCVPIMKRLFHVQ